MAVGFADRHFPRGRHHVARRDGSLPRERVRRVVEGRFVVILSRDFVRWYTLLQTLLGTRTGRGDHGSTPENEESARTLQNPYHQADHGEEVWMMPLVDETPTKHWTTVVGIPNEAVSAECRCGWVMESDEDRPIPTQTEQASAAARRHREGSIVTHQDAPGGRSEGPRAPMGPG